MTKKQTILAALVVVLAGTANASIGDSVANVKASGAESAVSLKQSFEASKNAFTFISKYSGKAIDLAKESASQAKDMVVESGKYIFNTPSDQMSQDASKNFEYLVTSTAGLVRVSGKKVSTASKTVWETPSGQLSVMSRDGIINFVDDVIITPSGNLLTASGDLVVDMSGEPVKLMIDASGNFVKLTVGSAILVKDDVSAVAEELGTYIVVIGAQSVTLSGLSVKDADELVHSRMASRDVALATGESFEVSTPQASADQYEKQKGNK